MLKKLRTRIKGQSTAEYAILIALVVAAVIAMQTYAKRALQAKTRDAVVWMKDQTNALGNSIQYEPYYLQSNFVVSRDMNMAQVQGTNLVGYNGTQGITRESGGSQQLTYNAQNINAAP